MKESLPQLPKASKEINNKEQVWYGIVWYGMRTKSNQHALQSFVQYEIVQCKGFTSEHRIYCILTFSFLHLESAEIWSKQE
jgi:hypothetical protein